jgi:hypothetical protein
MADPRLVKLYDKMVAQKEEIDRLRDEVESLTRKRDALNEENTDLISSKCIHGIDDDGEYPCEQCIDLLQIEDWEEFLRRIVEVGDE